MPTSQKPTLKLSKLLVSNLPLLVDTAVETLESFTELEAKKVSHGIQAFPVNIGSNIISAMMRFRGDVEGAFILAFPSTIASKVLEGLLGEEVSPNSMVDLLDGVSEFCNIITGSCKTKLSERDVGITFELPKRFGSIDLLLVEIGDDMGIWIELSLGGEPVYIFLSR